VCSGRVYVVLMLELFLFAPLIRYDNGNNSKIRMTVWMFWSAIQIQTFSLHILKSASANRFSCNWLMSDILGRMDTLIWWCFRCMARLLNQVCRASSKEFLKVGLDASKVILDANKI
jgi:hypothetical protein